LYDVIATTPVHPFQIHPIAHRAPLEVPLYHSPELHPGPCSNVGMRRGTDRQTHRQIDTDRQTAAVNIHFASAMLCAKCNNNHYLVKV